MDRMRPMYTSQKSNQKAPLSPVHHGHSRSSSISSARKPQNTKAAAQRLAQVMAHQTDDDDGDDDDDILCDTASVSLSAGIGLAGGRSSRNRSPMSVRVPAEPPVSIRSAPRRASSEQQQSFAHSNSASRLSQLKSVVEQPSSSLTTRLSQLSSSSVVQSPPPRSISTARSSQPTTTEQPLSARSSQGARSSQSINSVEVTTEQPLSARSTSASRSNLGPKPVPLVPSTVPITLKNVASPTPAHQSDRLKDRRLSLDFGTFKNKEPTCQTSSSALQDELDMLQEENESLLEKLRLAEEHFEEAEARARQLEIQVANLGEGVSLDARLLIRKEAALQQREAALKVATQSHGGGGGGNSEEVKALRAEAENARDEATLALDKLNNATSEIKSLRNMLKRMILTEEETEEVVLKRCWLARYWGLCAQLGIQSDIAGAKYEYWSSHAPLPLELVLEAGQNAKEENGLVYNDAAEREDLRVDVEHSTEGSVESMLLVDKGLRELASLKVEEAISLAIAQKRRLSALKSSETGQDIAETFELNEEESEDVKFKQAWLLYFWRRAKNHGLEADIAEERLNFWINQGDQPLNSHDAVNVERGLIELKKLGIESQLWQASRKLLDPETTTKMLKDNNF